MKYFNTLNEMSASFVAKRHAIELGNCEECRMFFHIHPSAELLLVTSGELTVNFLSKESETVKAGSCAMIFPFQSHSYDRPRGTEYFRFNFIPSMIQSFFAPNKNSVGERAVFNVNLDEYRVFFDNVRKGELSLYKVKSFLYGIAADYEKQVSFYEKGVDDTILSKVISYINEHKSEKVTLADTAQALGYNEKYLSRSINQSSGFGFSTLLSMLRMDAAGYLLKNSNRTIVDIAMACGFGSECTFYRQFKQITGYTPKEYRKYRTNKIIANDAVLY